MVMSAINLRILFLITVVCSSAASFFNKQFRSLFRGLPISIPAAVAGSAIAIEAYSRLPQKLLFGSTPRPLEQFDDKDIVIIFPGAGGPDENTSNLAQAVIESDKLCGVKRHVEVYDWSPWKGNLIRASYDGQSVGKIIGEQLAEGFGDLKSVHVMGVSVGAFAADSCCHHFQKKSQNKKSASVPTYVRATFLDPFTQRGLFGTKYGTKLFGKAAAFCEHYLNTDDPVPSTNEPLSKAIVYDITASESRKLFIPLKGDSMHSWPVAYYGRQWETKLNEDGTLFHPLHTSDTLRGTVISVP
jgi:hypothetical protein